MTRTSTDDGTVDVVTMGETMALISSAEPGALMRGAPMRLSMGGSECNVAIGLSRLGVSSGWVGRLGADALGDLIEREMRAEGVRAFVTRDAARPTGLMVKERLTETFATIHYYRQNSAGASLSPADVPSAVLGRARLLHVTGITPALSDTACEAVFHAIELARQANAVVSVDLNYRAALWPKEEARVTFTRLLAEADVVFAGEDEARVVVDGDVDFWDAARGLCELGPREAVIKRGARGAAIVADRVEHVRDALEVQAVDSVGAGDAFVAGYLSELLSGQEVAVRLDTAIRAGALACLTVGDWEGMPRRSGLRLFDTSEPTLR